MPKQYNFQNIRQLLMRGFSIQELDNFCHDQVEFRPVRDRLPSSLKTVSKQQFVDELVAFADQKSVLDQLLDWVKTNHPRIYKEYEPYVVSTTVPAPEDNTVKNGQPPSSSGDELAYVTYHVEVTPDGQGVHVTIRHPNGLEAGQPRGMFCPEGVRVDLLDKIAGGTASRREIEQVGESLFKALFCDPALGEHFRYTFRQAEERQQGLRLELDFDESRTPVIAALPWEFIRAPQTAGYPSLTFATHPDLVLSRRRSLWQPPRQLVKTGPWRILLAVAAPDDLGPVAYSQVVQELQGLTQQPEARFELAGEPILAANPISLDEALADEPDILHFVGHGRFVADQEDPHGELAMVGAAGGAEWLRDEDFSSLLERHVPAVVFLQACEGGALSSARGLTGVASKIVQQNVPVVVAMQYPITNAAALLFARKFYERLAAGDPVDKAAQEGRRALWFKYIGKREFANPVLFMRTPGGKLFSN